MTKVVSINKRSFDQQAADWIRSAVMSGDLAPGIRVTEVGLAEQIGLSRSTVRTAMQRLAGEGLLVQHAYSGWEVASLTVDDAWELYSLRASLEGLASNLAAARIDDASRKVLHEALEELRLAVQARDPRRVAAADMGLHRTIVSAAKHRKLMMMHSQIIDSIQLYALFYVRSVSADTFDALIPVHAELVETILSGDSDKAQRLACEHVSFSCEKVLNRLRR